MRHIFVLIFAAVIGISTAYADGKTTITFLHINDVYEISPGKDGSGGFSQIATLMNEEKSRPNTFVTFGGDLLSPSLLSGITEGAHMIEFMNKLGTNLAVPGNHEFDFGPDIFNARLKESNFPWFAANLMGSDAVIANKIIEIEGGYKIGIFGLVTPDVVDLSSPGENFTFAPLLETAEAQVALLKEAGADVIVALTHNSFKEDESLMGIKGLNLILGGHDHDPMTFYDGRVLLHKSGEDAQYLGVVTLELERKEGSKGPYVAVSPSWNMRLAKDVAKDPVIEDLVISYNTMLDDRLGKTIASLTAPLDSRKSVIRTEEDSMGNFITDALRAETKADIALTNGGGIRGNHEYSAGIDITRKDILTELPFGNVAVVLKMSGEEIWQMLEHGVSKVEEKAGRFLQTSGLHFTYNPAAEAGKRVLEVTVGGMPIDRHKTYSVATNDYIANGGDGFSMLKGAKRLVDASGAKLMANMVMDYAQKKEKIDVKVEGRITTK